MNIGKARGAQLARYRLHDVGMVFQDARLLEGLTAVQNVALPGFIAKVPRAAAVERAQALLQDLHVPVDTKAEQLSGGETQRAGLARALMNAPVLLLADEPTGSLDAELKGVIADLIFALPRERNCALVIVTHDGDIARRADRTSNLTGAPQ